MPAGLSTMKSAGDEDARVLELIERLERLQSQLDDLNNGLKGHLERMRRRRRSGKARLASFNHQAKKLADRAPS
jgi:hypothetical protein